MYRRTSTVDMKWYEGLAIMAIIIGEIVGIISLFQGGNGNVAFFMIAVGVVAAIFLKGVWKLLLSGLELFLFTGYMQDSWPNIQFEYGLIMFICYILTWIAYLRNKY